MLSSCGGGNDSSGPAATTAGPTAETGPTQTASKRPGALPGATGKDGTSQRKRSDRTRDHQGGTQSERQKRGTSKKKSKGEDKSANTGPSPDYTAQEYELYRQSKQVCKIFTLDGLARQYHVKKRPGDVAAAYAKAYVETFKTPALHDAVEAGCRAGLTK